MNYFVSLETDISLEMVGYLSFRSVKRLTEEICDCEIVEKINGFLIPFILK